LTEMRDLMRIRTR